VKFGREKTRLISTLIKKPRGYCKKNSVWFFDPRVTFWARFVYEKQNQQRVARSKSHAGASYRRAENQMACGARQVLFMPSHSCKIVGRDEKAEAGLM
jgi:hypothetical protein